MTLRPDCRGSRYAVCCVEDSATEILDKFIREADSDQDGGHSLIVISNLDQRYTEPTQPPVTPSPAPFKGKDPAECLDLVYKTTAENKSDINYEYIAILDDRSTKDSTALLVSVGLDVEGKQFAFRAEFKICNTALVCMNVKGLGQDYWEIAQKDPEGVLRWEPPMHSAPKDPGTAKPGRAPRKQLASKNDRREAPAE